MKTIVFIILIATFPLHSVYADDKADLVGVWSYVSETDTRPDGSPAPLLAQTNAEGLLIYTADGYMSVTIMPKNRNWSTDTATINELRGTMANGTAYAGRYEVDTSAHTVTHINSVNLDPGYNGARLVRSYSLHDDTLQLSGTFFFQGKNMRFVITWKRMTANG